MGHECEALLSSSAATRVWTRGRGNGVPWPLHGLPGGVDAPAASRWPTESDPSVSAED